MTDDAIRRAFNQLSDEQKKKLVSASAEALASKGVNDNTLVPTVIESEARGDRAWDIFSRLLKSRMVILTGEVNDQTANLIIAQLRWLNSEDDGTEIEFYIQSPGGSVSAGLSIYDTIRNIKAPVRTIGMGMCASMGSFLLAAGTPGKRVVLPNTKVMIHQLWSQGNLGKAYDASLSAADMKKLERRLERLLTFFMGLPTGDADVSRKMQRAMRSDTFLNATAARKVGLVDDILYPKSSPERQAEFDLIREIDEDELASIDANDLSFDSHQAVKELIEVREKLHAAKVQAMPLPKPANQP